MSLSELRRWPDFVSTVAARNAQHGVGLRSLGAALFAIVLSTSACGELPPTAADLPRRAISDGANLGNTHFYFLPPMVPNPSYEGTPDPGQQPRVVICEYAPGGCEKVVATFTSTDGMGAELVRYDATGGHYSVNWHTDRCASGPCALDVTKTYRLIVFSGAAELGHADLDVVGSGRELKNVVTNEYIALLNGRTLPIKFRIEQGATAKVASGASAMVGSEGAALTNSEETVGLTIGDGALTSPTPISINTITPPAPGAGDFAPVVDLGPDGQTFEEPILLSIRFDPTKLPAGVPLSALAPVFFDGTGWVLLPGGTIDSLGNTVSVPIEHFSSYSIAIAPNTALPGPPWSVVKGETASFRAWTYSYQSSSTTSCWLARPWDPTSQTCSSTVVAIPAANVAVQWRTLTPHRLSLATTTTYTDATGAAQSPVVTGLERGMATVQATAGSSTYSIFVPVIARLAFVPKVRTSVPGWLVPQVLRANDAVSYLTYVSLQGQMDGTDIIDPVNSTVVPLGASIPWSAGASERALTLRTGGLFGTRSLWVVASGQYISDTASITIARGVLRADGWQPTLVVGDSMPVRLTVTDLEGNAGTLSSPIVLASQVIDGGLSFSFSGNITQQSSSTFYVKATSTGVKRLSFTHPFYRTDTLSVNVIAPPNPPAINPTPQGPFFQNLMIAAAGTSTTAVIPITNAGGGTLTGLNIGGTPRNCYSGAPVPWFTFAFDATTAPTNLRITVNVPAGTPVGDVDVCHFTIRATGAADYEYGARVRVQPAPAINPTPQGALQSLIQVLPGGSATAVVPIANAGGGTLTGLNIGGTPANCYSGQPIPWLTFTFDATTAPTNLRMTANVPAGTPYGSYDVCYFTIRATGAVDWNYGVRISVQEVVVPNGPFINPNPQAPSQNQMTVRAGETGSKDVPIANAGGAPLSGVSLVGPVLNCFSGEAYTWLTHQWVGGTTAPTTLRLTASPPAGTPAGAISMCFELRARSAGAPDYRYGVVVNVQPGYTLSMGDMGTVANGSSVASSINASGQVVGYSNGLTALWSSPTATATPVVHPYGDLGYGFTINNAGVIAGRTPYTGFLYNTASGTFQASPGAFPVTNRTWGHANNNTGLMLVCSDNGQFAQNHVWNPATNTNTLIPNSYNWCDGRINDAGKVVVSDEQSGRARYYDAVTATSTTIPTFNGRTVARDINSANIVVGSSINASNQVRAFRWDPATNQMLDIGTLGGTEAEAFGINDLGWIVGWSRTGTGARHAFARNPASGHLYDLGALSGYDQSGAMDISETLQVIGWSSMGDPGGLGGMPRTIGVITGTTRATRWRLQ